MIETCGLSHSILLIPHKMPSFVSKKQESSEMWRDRKKARMETALKVVFHKGHGMRVKQCHMFPLTAVCSSKLSQKTPIDASLLFSYC